VAHEGRRHLCAPLEACLHEIDAAARAVELITEQAVGRAGGEAETAMHALAQNAVCFLALGRIFDEVCEIGLHL
jgi:hypothetical protein